MSGSDRHGEAHETRRPSLKVSMPRSVPSVPGQSSGIDSTTDTPIVSNTEVSSPYGEDDRSTPKLHIDTAKEVTSEGTDFNPPTAGLDTGVLGRKFWEEEAFANLDFLDPLIPSPDDAAIQFENRFNETEEVSGGAPGNEELLGPIEEGPVYDFGPFPEEPSLPPILHPTLLPPCERTHHMSNDALTSTYTYSNAELRASTPAFEVQPSGNTHVSGSSPRNPHSALRPHLGATEIVQGTGFSQHQVPYYTQPSHQTLPKDVRADCPFAAANVDVGGFSNAHFRALSNQQTGMSKRRSISDASIFLQHEHQNRKRMSHTLTNTPITRDRRQSGLRMSALSETTNPGYEQHPHAYSYGFSGHSVNNATPEVNAHYAQTQLSDHEEYPSREWQRGEEEHYSNAHAQQDFNNAGEQGGLYVGTTEPLPSQFRQADPSQARDAVTLPQQKVLEGETFFDSIDDAKKWRNRHLLPPQNNDPTIPRTKAEQKDVVRRFVQAINDTDEAMASSYVKYFTDQKYSPHHIESTCWMALDACILRHLHGPLQTEDERAPFKAKVADYNTCAERIEVVIRAFRTQKSICKQLMEPYHLYQFIDDPLAKIKRTENNKALNDRKAEQIAAGKALRGDETRARTRRGKQKSHDEEEHDDSHDVANAFTGLKSAAQNLRAVSSVSASNRSTPAPSAATSARKRKLESDAPGIDPTLQTEYSGPSSKKARIGPASSTATLNSGQPQQSYQTHSLGSFADQSHGAEFGQHHPLGQLNASEYGNPSIGGIHGAPYFTQRPIAQRRPGQAYPEIEGYHTPSVGFGLPSTYNEGSAVGHDTGHGQQPTRALRQNMATTHPAISSGLDLLPAYTTSNPYSHSHESSRGQRKRQAEFEDDGSDFEASQSNRKRRRNA